MCLFFLIYELNFLKAIVWLWWPQPVAKLKEKQKKMKWKSTGEIKQAGPQHWWVAGSLLSSSHHRRAADSQSMGEEHQKRAHPLQSLPNNPTTLSNRALLTQAPCSLWTFSFSVSSVFFTSCCKVHSIPRPNFKPRELLGEGESTFPFVLGFSLQAQPA